MKQGKESLRALVDALEDQNTAKQDVIVDTRALEMKLNDEGHYELAVENQAFNTKPLVHQQIGARLDIPAKHYNRLKEELPDLLVHNVNTLFKHKPEKRMIRLLNEDARAFLSNGYKRVDNYEVALASMKLFGEFGINPGRDIKSSEITDTRMYLKVVNPQTRAEITGTRRKGDFVEAGVIIKNSEVGLGKIDVQPFYHFLVCTNGMTRAKTGKGFSQIHAGKRHQLESEQVFGILSEETANLEDELTLSRIRDTLRYCLDPATVQEAVHKMEQMTQRQIEGDVDKALEEVSKTLVLNQKEQSGVLRHLIEGGDTSQYGLMNAITRTAEDLDDYDRASELEAIGGSFLDMSEREWKQLTHVKRELVTA